MAAEPWRFRYLVLLLPIVPGVDLGADLALFSLCWLERWSDSQDPAGNAAREALFAEADAALALPPFSVVGAEILQASGDPHDYFSMGPYWWPNPDTPDGLPYVRRDGIVNPQRDKVSDRATLHGVCNAVRALGLAYAASGEERYAEHAANLLRAFFLEPETLMNPNLRHAQAIPGVTDGRGVGIIDARVFTRLVDGVTLIKESPAWDVKDHGRLKDWFVDYTRFLTQHPNGIDERNRPNNHGTAYDLQLAACLVFTGDREAARAHLESVSLARLTVQFAENGQQPLELARTKSWNYTWENLENWFRLAVLAEKLGVDLWTAHDSALRRGFAEALHWWRRTDLESSWRWQQIVPFSTADTGYVRAAGAIAYPDLAPAEDRGSWISALTLPDLMQLPTLPPRGASCSCHGQ